MEGCFKRLLEDGSQFGINLKYATQSSPDGLAQAFIIGEEFIGHDDVCLALGDNIFYGQGLTILLQQAVSELDGATIFAHPVKDPKRFGIVEFNKENKVISVEEKPEKPKSNYAITGLYFYNNDVVKIAKSIKPSARGELEITSINQSYMQRGDLNAINLGRGFSWLDTGTYQSLLDASQFVETIQNRQGYKIACLEEIGFNKGWISEKQIKDIVKIMGKNSYSNYLLSLLEKNKNTI